MFFDIFFLHTIQVKKNIIYMTKKWKNIFLVFVSCNLHKDLTIDEQHMLLSLMLFSQGIVEQ